MIDINSLLKPGVHWVNMSHDYGCPAIDTQSALDCRCNPEFSEVSEEAWLKGVQLTRKQRRRAARESAKAMLKLRGAK